MKILYLTALDEFTHKGMVYRVGETLKFKNEQDVDFFLKNSHEEIRTFHIGPHLLSNFIEVKHLAVLVWNKENKSSWKEGEK